MKDQSNNQQVTKDKTHFVKNFNICPTRCDFIQFITFLQAAQYVSGVDTHHQQLVQL